MSPTSVPRPPARLILRPLPADPGPAYPWMALAAVLGGTYLFVLAITVPTVALPAIGQDFGGAAVGVDWVITGYLLALAVVQPATAWAPDRFGRERIYLLAIIVFLLGSVLCALAPSLEALVLGRFVQGFGGGAMQPIGMAIILTVFAPARRGGALGVWGIAVMVAPAIGAPLGGWLTAAVGWRWIFIGILGWGVLALLAAVLVLRDSGRTEPGPGPFHWTGWLAGGLALSAAVIGGRNAPEWGYASPQTLVAAVLAVSAAAVFVVASRRQDHSLIRFETLGFPAFRASLVIIGLTTTVLYALLTFLPIGLQTVQGFDAVLTGLTLSGFAVGMAVTMPIGGRVADRIGPRRPASAGLVVAAVAFWQLGTLSPDSRPWWVLAVLLLAGLGIGLAQMPVTVSGINALPMSLLNQGTMQQSLHRQASAAIGTAALAAIVVALLGDIRPLPGADPQDAQAAYNWVFRVTTVLLVIAFLAGRALADRPPGEEPGSLAAEH